jgi:hypothetical protein
VNETNPYCYLKPQPTELGPFVRPQDKTCASGKCWREPHFLTAVFTDFFQFTFRTLPELGYNRGSRELDARAAVMGFKLDRVHVWAGEVMDQAGGVAAKLQLLAQAGANLEYIYTRRQPDKPGTGVLLVAPISGPMQLRAAKSAGLHETNNPVVLRVEGDNQAGLGHRLTQQWALAGLSLQGLTLAVLADKFVGYVSFDTVADSNRAAAILGDLGSV